MNTGAREAARRVDRVLRRRRRRRRRLALGRGERARATTSSSPTRRTTSGSTRAGCRSRASGCSRTSCRRRGFRRFVPFTGAGCMAMHRGCSRRSAASTRRSSSRTSTSASGPSSTDGADRAHAGRGAALPLPADATAGSSARPTRYGLGDGGVQRRYKQPGERYPKQRRWLIPAGSRCSGACRVPSAAGTAPSSSGSSAGSWAATAAASSTGCSRSSAAGLGEVAGERAAIGVPRPRGSEAP